MAIRKDLLRMQNNIKRVKNPFGPAAATEPVEKAAVASTTAVNKKTPSSLDDIENSEQYQNMKKKMEEEKQKKQNELEADQMTSDYIYSKGHSTNKKYEEASPDEKRSMIINREYNR